MKIHKNYRIICGGYTIPKNENSQKLQKIIWWVDIGEIPKNENSVNFQNNLWWVDPQPCCPYPMQDK